MYRGSILLKFKIINAYLRIHIITYNSVMIVEDSRHRFTVINLNDSPVAIGKILSLPT